jgi:hypothetical protein
MTIVGYGLKAKIVFDLLTTPVWQGERQHFSNPQSVTGVNEGRQREV